MSNKFRCILCLNEVEVRKDINDKPYMQCMECGVQFFIRKKLGEERLLKLLKHFEEGQMISFSKISNPFECPWR